MRYVSAVAMLVLFLAGQLVSQTPATAPSAMPVVQNAGRPMVLPYNCTAEDIQWAGLDCSEEVPCPVYLELDSAASVGNKFFAAGNIHSDAVTLYSVLLGSDDAGRTWREAAPRVRGSGLDHLQFLDSAMGLVSGQQLFPLPQDPFFLLTSDGGQTWHQRPVLRENAEDRFGTVLQFYFNPGGDGRLIFDRGQGSGTGRYALYESPDRGESWRIKEESERPLQIQIPPQASAGWRVRTDAATKSFQLERRVEQRWVSQAAFAVDLGTCKDLR